MHPLTGTPFAWWMTSVMCWGRLIDRFAANSPSHERR